MDLRSYFSIIRKWFWLVILCAVLAGTAAFFYSRQQTPIYQSTATVFINQARSSTGNSDYTDIITSERISGTYSKMITTRPILEEVAKRVGVTVEYLDDRITVSPIRDTTLIQITVKSSDPILAAQIANEFTEQIRQLGPNPVTAGLKKNCAAAGAR